MAFLPSASPSSSSRAADLETSLAIPARLLLLLPIGLISLVGMRAAFANYGFGADAQLHRLGGWLLFLAAGAVTALLLSLWQRASPRLRRASLGVAVALTIFGLVWGLPAESHNRSVAMQCACEGG